MSDAIEQRQEGGDPVSLSGETPESVRPLTHKQRVFVEEYLTCWNATEAARRAGYSDRSARQIGQQNLSKVDILAEIQARLSEKHVGADEAMAILAEHARGDVGEFMDVTGMGFTLQLLNEEGNRKNTRIIKKIKQKTTTFIAKKESEEDREVHEIEIELYDAQAAVDKILRVAGKYKDAVDITTDGKPIIPPHDYSRLTVEELQSLRALMLKAKGDG